MLAYATFGLNRQREKKKTLEQSVILIMFKVFLLQNRACEQVQEDNTRAAAILNWANLESGLLR